MENWIFGEWKSSREWRAAAVKATECFNWKSPLICFCVFDCELLISFFSFGHRSAWVGFSWIQKNCSRFQTAKDEPHLELKYASSNHWRFNLSFILSFSFSGHSRVFWKIILRLHWSIKLAHTKRMDFLPTAPSRSSNPLETSAIEHFTSRNVHISTLRCDIRPRYPHEIKMNSRIQLKSFLRVTNRAQSSYSWRHMCELVIRCHAWSTSLRDTQNDIEIYKSSKVEIWFWRVLAHSAMRIASNWNMQPSFRHWERFTFIDFFLLVQLHPVFFLLFRVLCASMVSQSLRAA